MASEEGNPKPKKDPTVTKLSIELNVLRQCNEYFMRELKKRPQLTIPVEDPSMESFVSVQRYDPATFYPDGPRLILVVAMDDYGIGQDKDTQDLREALVRDENDVFLNQLCGSTAEIRQTLEQLARERLRGPEKKFGCVFLVLLAHGCRDKHVDYLTKKIGKSAKNVDDTWSNLAFPVLDILDIFDVSRCPNRAGVPLVCLVSSCRGTRPNMAQMTATQSNDSMREMPNICDTRIVMASVENSPAFTSTEGSYFITKFCELWKKNYTLDDVILQIRDEASLVPYRDNHMTTFRVPSDVHNSLTKRVKTNFR